MTGQALKNGTRSADYEYEKLAASIIATGNAAEEDLARLLSVASDQYYNNDGESFLSDGNYDLLELLMKELYPNNPFLATIGSDVRGGKVPLPYVLGSLDQVYENETAKWIKENGWDDEDFVLGNKEDGYSCLAIYGKGGAFQAAYSRGNGTEGADVSRHARRIKSFPKKLSNPCAVRLEIIMEKKTFYDRLKSHPETMNKTNGTPYKNPRNYVSGRMNAIESSDWFYANVLAVATSLVEPKLGKVEQYEFLTKNGWRVPFHTVRKGRIIQDDMLISYLEQQRSRSLTEIDGIVIDLDNPVLRARLRRKSSSINPMYSKKFKIGSEENVAFPRVVKVHWQGSKDGYLKPRVEIEPVDLMGVTITYCTGFNAKFIRDNGIGPGARIQVTRAGDVIPFIVKVIERVNQPSLPDADEFGEMEWTKGEVDLKLVDASNNRDVQVSILTEMFLKLEIPFLRIGNIEKLYDAGYKTAASIIKAPCKALQQILGDSAGEKVYNGLKSKLNPVLLSVLAGSSQTLGRGIGRTRMAKLVELLPTMDDWTVENIVKVQGFDQITAKTIVDNLPKFQKFLDAIQGFYKIEEPSTVSDGVLQGTSFVFTGFRDKEIEALIESKGGKILNTVTKDTTFLVTKDPRATSSKLTKARAFGVKVIGVKELDYIIK